MGQTRMVRSVRPLDMSWIDNIACTDVPPEAFVINGNVIRDHHFELIALCRFRCKVQKPCLKFNAELTRGHIEKRRMIAGGVIIGQAEKPHWRNLTKVEEKRFDTWCENTGSRSLLW